MSCWQSEVLIHVNTEVCIVVCVRLYGASNAPPSLGELCHSLRVITARSPALERGKELLLQELSPIVPLATLDLRIEKLFEFQRESLRSCK